jgi:hypothetical protein
MIPTVLSLPEPTLNHTTSIRAACHTLIAILLSLHPVCVTLQVGLVHGPVTLLAARVSIGPLISSSRPRNCIHMESQRRIQRTTQHTANERKFSSPGSSCMRRFKLFRSTVDVAAVSVSPLVCPCVLVRAACIVRVVLVIKLVCAVSSHVVRLCPPGSSVGAAAARRVDSTRFDSAAKKGSTRLSRSPLRVHATRHQIEGRKAADTEDGQCADKKPIAHIHARTIARSLAGESQRDRCRRCSRRCSTRTACAHATPGPAHPLHASSLARLYPD